MHKILIVVPDCTRKAHLRIVLPKLLKKIESDSSRRGGLNLPYGYAGVKIIVATGLHKPHTKAELKKLVGEKIFSDYEVVTHMQKKSDLVNRGTTKGGIPIVLNKTIFEADEIITIGLIEPHLYAGYSGGAKTIAIGLAGEETINATHHPRFLDKAGTTIGSVRNNPFQDCLWEIIEGLPVKCSATVINDQDGKLRKLSIKKLNGKIREKEGKIREFKREFYKGIRFAKRIFEKKLNKTFDAVICEVSPPKDVNMYQASRAFNYVLNVKRPIVKKGGMVLVRACLKDGFGKGAGEKRFAAALKKMRSPEDLIKKVKSRGCVAGEHRAYMVARAMTKARLGFIGPRAIFYAKNLPFLAFKDIQSAKKFAQMNKNKSVKIYTISHALSTVISKGRNL